MNEFLLILSLVFLYVGVVVSYKLFGKSGLYIFIVIATIIANIEVLVLVKAFSLEQTLGNILFATTFLTTDILSEFESKKAANKAVYLGLFTSVVFIFIIYTWLNYIPSENDIALGLIKDLFENVPNIMIISIIVYFVSQKFDVFIYHKIWQITSNKTNDKEKYLWLRNNLSTMLSQLLNTVLFTFLAFYRLYDLSTILSIIISTYLIYLVTSLLDTPVLYLIRHLKNKKKFGTIFKED